MFLARGLSFVAGEGASSRVAGARRRRRASITARAGQRVVESISGFITQRLKLQVNQAKSAVARPPRRKFLGFSFTWDREPRRRIAPKALARFKQRVRELTCRRRGVSLEARVAELSPTSGAGEAISASARHLG